jgi:HAD superfamily hydrolase (TIGR01458 family)
MTGFADVGLVLLDLDGTVYEGSRPVPGAAAALERLRRDGRVLRFLTNTDSVPPAALVGRLRGMGVEAAAGEVLTPVALAARLFGERPGSRVLAVAAPPIRELLAGVLAGPGVAPTHVLVCDASFGACYDDLDAAFRAVLGGAELVASQVNRSVRRDDGEHLDTGGFVRLIEYAAGVQARVLGKPSPEFFRLALDAADVAPARALVVGDDLGADVAGAQAAGLRAVLVRTGKGAGPLPPAGDPGAPDAVIDSLAALPALLDAPTDT